MKEKVMSLTVECEDCKNKFIISSEKSVGVGEVNHKKEFNINGKSIFLTYYDCPSCGRRHFVQIDDKTSLDLLDEVNAMFIKLSVAKSKGKKIPRKQLAKFEKARQYLSVYRMELMREFTDKSFHDDETDSDVVLRFSV